MEIKGVKILGVGGIGGALAAPLCRYLQYTVNSDEPITITLIDGDKYERKNLDRQNCAWGDLNTNKAQAELEKLQAEFGTLDIEVYPSYITPMNIDSVIKDGDVVFCGVDNHKTRKVLADYAKTLDNIVIISGGNEMTDGGVQIFIKKDGKRITANLDEYHPEIADPKDKSPDEVGCAEMAPSAPQLYFMNMQVA